MIFAKNSARNCGKKNKSWNIRHLVAGSFVQTNQRPIVFNYRWTDFKSILLVCFCGHLQ